MQNKNEFLSDVYVMFCVVDLVKVVYSLIAWTDWTESNTTLCCYSWLRQASLCYTSFFSYRTIAMLHYSIYTIFLWENMYTCMYMKLFPLKLSHAEVGISNTYSETPRKAIFPSQHFTKREKKEEKKCEWTDKIDWYGLAWDWAKKTTIRISNSVVIYNISKIKLLKLFGKST